MTNAPPRSLLGRILCSEQPRLEHGLGVLVAAVSISIAATNAAYVACLALFLRDWYSGRRQPSATPLDGAILVWVLLNLLSAATSLDPLRSLRDFRNLGLWGIYYVLVWGIRGGAGLGTLQPVWLGAGMAAATQGLLQEAVGFDLRGRGVDKAIGFFNGHLELGHAMVVLLGAALARWIDEPSERARAWFRLAVATLGGGLVVSKGRGAWLAFGAVVGALAWTRRSWWIALPVVAVVVLQVGFLAAEPEGLGAYYSSYVAFEPESAAVAPPERVFSNLWRLTMWREGLRLFARRPITGMGIETTGELSQDFRTPWRDFGVAHLHSSYFEILMSRGFLGLAGFFLLLWVAGRTLGAGLARVAPGVERAAVFGGLAAVVAQAVHGLTHFTIGTATIQMGFYVALGLAVGGLPRDLRSIFAVDAGGVARGMVVIAALLVAEPWLAESPLVGMAVAAVAAADWLLRPRARRSPLPVALASALVFVVIASIVLVLPLTGAQSAAAIVGAASWPFAIGYGAWLSASRSTDGGTG